MLTRLCFLVVLFLNLCSTVAYADSTSVVKVGLTLRSRIETTDNSTCLQSRLEQGSSYFRNRTGLMMQVFPARRMEVGFRFTNEFRRYFVPESKPFTWDEVVIDQLYARVDSVSASPLSLTIGRQNIILGEGFVISDGGPLDGSRTAYFNAIKLDWQFSPKTNLRLIYASQQVNDDLLPIIHDQHKVMAEQDETAGILYLTSQVKWVGLDAYVIQKGIRRSSKSPNADITCVGVRTQAQFGPNVSWTTEFADQFGAWGHADQKSCGGYSYVDVSTGWPTFCPNKFTLGGVYLSGDDLSSSNNEGWEPMFGRWPKWSESYAYTLSRESGSAYWTDYGAVFGKVSAVLSADVSLTLEYHHMMAPEAPTWDELPIEDATVEVFPGGTGHVRGNLTVVKLAYLLKPRLSGHLIFEQFSPGTFYNGRSEPSAWMRMEMLLRI